MSLLFLCVCFLRVKLFVQRRQFNSVRKWCYIYLFFFFFLFFFFNMYLYRVMFVLNNESGSFLCQLAIAFYRPDVNLTGSSFGRSNSDISKIQIYAHFKTFLTKQQQQNNRKNRESLETTKSFCGLTKGISPNICNLCVRVMINNRSFEPFCVWSLETISRNRTRQKEQHDQVEEEEPKQDFGVK